MKRMFLTVASLFFMGSSAHAGMLSGKPPEDFLNMPIVSDNGRYEMVTYSVLDMEKYFQVKGSVDWDKSDASWLMKTNTADKATGKSTKIVFVMSKHDDRVGVDRLVVDGQDSKNLINGFMASIGAEIGKPYKKISGKQPSQKFLALKILNGSTGGVYDFTTTDVAEYFKSKGATVSWDGPNSQTGEYTLKIKQSSPTVVKFSEDNASWEDSGGDLKQESAARMNSNKVAQEVAAWMKKKK